MSIKIDFLYITRDKNNDLLVTYRQNGISSYFTLKNQDSMFFDLYDVIRAITSDYSSKFKIEESDDLDDYDY